MGFYYLKSRYYDPNICRFINADGLASTGQGFLGCNMFAYCYNRAVSFEDDSGKDAIWIQELKSAGYAGHTGLLVQDGDGAWWFFYWGPNDSGDLSIKTMIDAISGQPLSNGC